LIVFALYRGVMFSQHCQESGFQDSWPTSTGDNATVQYHLRSCFRWKGYWELHQVFRFVLPCLH